MVLVRRIGKITTSDDLLWPICLPVLPFVRMSVCSHGRTQHPVDGFSWNLIFDYFSKICGENSGFFCFPNKWNNNYYNMTWEVLRMPVRSLKSMCCGALNTYRHMNTFSSQNSKTCKVLEQARPWDSNRQDPVTLCNRKQHRSWSFSIDNLNSANVTNASFGKTSVNFGYYIFTNLRKATNNFITSRSHGTTRLHLEWFSWNFIFEYFSKLCWENLSFIKIVQE